MELLPPRMCPLALGTPSSAWAWESNVSTSVCSRIFLGSSKWVCHLVQAQELDRTVIRWQPTDSRQYHLLQLYVIAIIRWKVYGVEHKLDITWIWYKKSTKMNSFYLKTEAKQTRKENFYVQMNVV